MDTSTEAAPNAGKKKRGGGCCADHADSEGDQAGPGNDDEVQHYCGD